MASDHSWRLGEFSGAGYDRGRSFLVHALWVAVSAAVTAHVWCPGWLRVSILRLFGAKIGRGVVIRHKVEIHLPWKLSIGNDVWVGVGAWLLNLEPISIGSNVCISQGAMLCTGSHSVSSPTFEYDNAPIHIGDGAWIAVRATVLRGVTIGRNAVVGATALVVKDVPDGVTVLAPAATFVRNADGE